ncbi:MAG: hypothetical protein JOZ67_00090 [Gammaproteobacteria bacterium]|nr:hypothetical protein [Gammaproteobacteria bacterium]MBV9697933.1 hypothetical protein [Gammaproteobacteria bacterium]
MDDAANEEARRREAQRKRQRQLDEALANTFPASDPVSIVTSIAEDEDDPPPPSRAPPPER